MMAVLMSPETLPSRFAVEEEPIVVAPAAAVGAGPRILAVRRWLDAGRRAIAAHRLARDRQGAAAW